MWLVLQGNYPGTNQSAIHSNYNKLYMSGSIHFLIGTSAFDVQNLLLPKAKRNIKLNGDFLNKEGQYVLTLPSALFFIL